MKALARPYTPPLRMALLCLLSISAGSSPAAPVEEDPIPANGVFLLEKDGVSLGFFGEVSGIGSGHDVTESNVTGPGGEETIVKLPGRLNWDLVTLRKPMGNSQELWAWRQMVVNGDVDLARSPLKLTNFDQTGAVVAEWTFKDGWPSKLGVTGTTGGGGAMEELTFAHDGLQRDGIGRLATFGGEYKIEAGSLSMYFDSLSFASENVATVQSQFIDGVWVNRATPGRLKINDIILSRPVDFDVSLWDWRQLVVEGSGAGRRSVTIIAYQPDGSERARWTVAAGFPSRLEVSMLPDGPAIETLHISIEDMSIDNSPPALLLPTSFNAPVGSTAEFAVTASDPNNDPVAVTQLGAPAGASFNLGAFSWPVPVSAVETSALVTFRADDLRGAPNSIVTKSLTITIPRDYDVDSLDDDWEVIWFGSIGKAPGEDEDGDGASNLNEFLAATSPVDPTSLLRISGVTKTATGVEISYIAEPGIQYQLEMNSTGLDATGWSVTGPTWTETNPTRTLRVLTDVTAPVATVPMRFYRISARRK